MSLLHMEDFWGQTVSTTEYAMAPGMGMTTPRFPTGGQSAVASGTLGVANSSRPFPARSEVILGFAFYAYDQRAVQLVGFYSGGVGGVQQVLVSRTVGGVLTISIGATVVATGASPLVRLGWNYFEVRAKLDPTAGYVEVRAQGLVGSPLTFTGNTRASGTATTLDTYGIYMPTNCQFGDLYLLDTAGSRLNDFLGEQKVFAAVPTGAGSSTGFTPSAGSNWSNVDEQPVSTADYNAATVSGTRDTYQMGDIATNNAILAVKADFWAHRDSTDPISLKAATKLGSSLYYGPSVSLGTTPVRTELIYETSPATSTDWTVTEFNGAEFGVEVV